MSYNPNNAARLKHLKDLGELLNEKLAAKAEKATTLSGYGITDAYTRSEIDAKLTSTFRAGGSLAFSALPTADEVHLGMVYNVTDAFVTNANFLEGAGKSYPAGTNVAVVAIPGENEGDPTVYKYDAGSGIVDLSGLAGKDEIPTVEASETQGCINVNGTDITVVSFASDSEVTEMLNEVFGDNT